MTEETGRVAQKKRTREAILEGARKLIADGKPVTVTEAAEVQGISKATAYRYFSDPALLVTEAGLAIEVWPYEKVVEGTHSLRDRLMAITLYIFDLSVAHEAAFRQFVGMTLTSTAHAEKPFRRGARRVQMFGRAIDESGAKLSRKNRDALIYGLTASTGTEAMIALYDIASVDAKTARATVEDIATALLDRHLGPT